MENPFVTGGYAGPEYFCDREKETTAIVQLLRNGNHIAMVSPRRMGKTDLLRHCFTQPEIQERYYTFIIDIYATSSLAEMTEKIGKVILDTLKPKGKKVWSRFVNIVASLRSSFNYDAAGMPSLSLGLGEIKAPATTLDEIFRFLNEAGKPCLVALDEFQQILKYPEKDVEATLRTYVQYCTNTRFVFSGSQRDMMGTMFTSASRPFYQSVTLFNLSPIDRRAYQSFCLKLFGQGSRFLDETVPLIIYDSFDAVTFFMQRMMNTLFLLTPAGGRCLPENIPQALDYILDFSALTYEDLMYQLPEKQRKVMIALAKEGAAKNITSSAFIKKNALISASSVQAGVKGLLEKGLVIQFRGTYSLYDLFLSHWICTRYLDEKA